MASDYPGGLDDFTTIVAAAGATLQLRIWNAYLSGPTPATPQPLFFWQAVAY